MKQRTIVSLVTTGILALLLLVTTGCVKQKVLVKINKDGSGKIIVTRIFGKAMTMMYEKQMEEMKKKMGDNPNVNMSQMDIFFNEQMLKMEAKQYGDVTYEKGKRLEKKYGKGSMAVYTFDDISKVKLALGSVMPTPGAMKSNKKSISFKLAEGSTDKLSIFIPQPDKSASESKAKKPKIQMNPEMKKKQREMMMQQMMAMGNPFGLTGDETEEEITAKMFKGMSIQYAVQVAGKIVKTDASFKSKKKKNRITLFSLNFDKLLKDKTFMSTLKDNPQAFKDSMISLAGKPGVKLEEKKEIYVEFK